MSYGAKNYKQTAIKTATPEQVLLMLYEAAIKAAKLAKIAMEKKQIADKGRHIAKVHDIVMELNNSLDHSKGPQVAEQLASLYEFCTAQLLKANLHNDPKALENVTSILTTLHEGWVAAVEEVRKSKQQGAKV
jgi:flagellar protein FliS